jgi:energy-converting hydrogenase Eha subunit C
MSTPLRDRRPQEKLFILASFVFGTCVLAANYYLDLGIFRNEPRASFFASVGVTAVLALYLAVVPPSRRPEDATKDQAGDRRPEPSGRGGGSHTADA